MKKYLLTAACIVALAGCGRSGANRMGSAAGSQSGSTAESTSDYSSINTNTTTFSGSGTLRNSLPTPSTNSVIAPSPGASDSGATLPPVPKSDQSPTTGDQSNGDLSNRPAGVPGQSDSGSDTNKAQSGPLSAPDQPPK